MPTSAISTGCVDSVLPPAGIARELVRLRQHPHLRDHPVARSAPVRNRCPSLREIFGLLRDATGVDFTLYKPGTIQRRTLRRMALLKMENLGQYAVCDSPASR